MSESNPLKKVLHQWGGADATFFTYTHMSHDLTTGLLPALLPMMKVGLGLTYLQASFLLSAFTVACGLSQFPGGWLGDRFNRPLVISLGLVGVGLATLSVGLSSGYYTLLLLFVLTGSFYGAYHPSATSLISSHFIAEIRGKVLALHMAGGSIGFTLGPILGGLIAACLGWHSAYTILSIPTLLAAFFVWLKFGRRPTGTAETGSQRRSDSVPAETNLWRAVGPIAVICVLSIAAQLLAATALSFFPIYLLEKHHVTAAAAAILLGVGRGGGIFGSLFGGWLSDAWGRKNAILVTLTAAGPALYLLTILPFNAVWLIIFFLFGALLYMRHSTTQPILMDYVPLHLRSTVFGIYFGMGMEGTSLLQPVAGYFMDIYGVVTVFYAAGLISVGLSLISFWIIRSSKLPQFSTT